MSRGLRWFIYVRVSTAREVMVSPEIQEYACRRLVERERGTVVQVIADLDLSGGDFARRKIDWMIDEIRQGHADGVVVYTWDRFGRDFLESKLRLRELETAAGGVARAAAEDFDTSTDWGEYNRDQALLLAELQHRQFSHGWKQAQSKRKRDGLPHTGRVLFGYLTCLVCPPRAQCQSCTQKGPGRHCRACPPQRRCERCLDGVLVPDPAVAPAYREMYERVVAGESLNGLAKEMQDRGIRSKFGRMITSTGWLSILDSGFAAGLCRYHSDQQRAEAKQAGRTLSSDSAPWAYDIWLPGRHEALVSADFFWNRYVRWRKERREAAAPRTGKASTHLLSGLVHCGHCGRRCRSGLDYSRDGTRYTHMRCSSALNFRGVCPGTSIAMHVLEEAVHAWIRTPLAGYAAPAPSATPGRGDEQERTRTRLEGERAKEEEALVRLLDLYEDPDGGLSKSAYLARKAQREARISVLDEVIGQLRAPWRSADPIHFEEIRAGLAQRWERPERADLRPMLQQVVSKVMVRQGSRWDPDRLLIVPVWADENELIAQWRARWPQKALDLDARVDTSEIYPWLNRPSS